MRYVCEEQRNVPILCMQSFLFIFILKAKKNFYFRAVNIDKAERQTIQVLTHTHIEREKLLVNEWQTIRIALGIDRKGDFVNHSMYDLSDNIVKLLLQPPCFKPFQKSTFRNMRIFSHFQQKTYRIVTITLSQVDLSVIIQFQNTAHAVNLWKKSLPSPCFASFPDDKFIV